MYTYAVKFIEENEILQISSKNTSLTALDYLEYFFYAGLCFIGMFLFIYFYIYIFI
jgi:hypothetical protein